MSAESRRTRVVRKGTLPVFPRSLLSEAALQLDEATELRPGHPIRHEKIFDVVERIGEGGMGKVYRAYDPVMDRYVALKVLKLDVPDLERARFRREAVVAADFSHPNLSRVLDRGRDPEAGLEWLTMEYLRGRDLGLILERRRTIAFGVLVDIFCQTLDALDYVHTRGIVHCDVKPDNIFVTRDPYDRRIVVVKLIDFGVCRLLGTDEPTRQIIGDPRYMAPEQATAGATVGPATDLYALGLSLFEAVAGDHPFVDPLEDCDNRELLGRQLRQSPPSIVQFRDDMPDALVEGIDRVVARACAKDPAQRFSDARSMKRAIAALLPGGPDAGGRR